MKAKGGESRVALNTALCFGPFMIQLSDIKYYYSLKVSLLM